MDEGNAKAKLILDEMLRISLQQLEALNERHLEPLPELIEQKRELMRQFESVEKAAIPEVREYLVRLHEVESKIQNEARQFLSDIYSQIFLVRSALKTSHAVPASVIDENA